MTDPRIEAAAQLIGSVVNFECGGDWNRLSDFQKKWFRDIAATVIQEADAAACVRVVPMPIPADRMEAAKNTLLCWKSGALTDEDAIGMIVCGVSGPQSPETITIPEVRNDRPIPVKGGVDG